MGPNNPNLQLEDTSDISYTSGGAETTSGRLPWGDGEAGTKQFMLNVKPYTSWEIQKVFVIEMYDIQGSPASVGNGEISPTNGKIVLTIEKFGDPNGIIEFTGVASTDRKRRNQQVINPHSLGSLSYDRQALVLQVLCRYNDNPHGLFGVRSENQEVLIDPVDLSRSLLLNFTRYFGTFGSTILTYTVDYDDGQAGVVLASKTGTVTFNNGKRNVQTTVAIQGAGFLALGSTFSLSLVDVTFVGDGVTQPPQLRAGETDAKVVVHDEAANSIVSFATTVINVDDGTATLTVTRQGTYGSVSIDWTAGELVGNLPTGVVNGQITPLSGFISLRHGLERKNFTVQVNARIGQAETFTLRLPRAPQTPVSGGARLAGQNLVATLDPSGVLRIMPSSSQPEVSELDRQNRETEKSVTVQLLDDQKAEPMETVLVYLTGVTGGARVAEGTTDGGIRGYAVITIQRSDTSNGIICFAENSKNVQANEDVQPITRLTLTRLNAFFGDVRVFWRAKLRADSSEVDDQQLLSQLVSLTGFTTCPAGESVCFLDIALIDDNTPEESFKFVVKLVSVEDDARLGESCRFATVTVLPSDDVRGLVQFVANSRNVGDNTESVRLGVERVQGLEFDIAVGTLGLLDGVAQDTLSDTEVTVFNYIINEINEKGSNQRHPDEVLNAMLDLLCKMLDPSKVDGTRGRHQLAAVLEKFAYTMLTDRPCPSPQPTSLRSDYFEMPDTMTLSTGADGMVL
nr:hypothetical protein BaRGS_033771 [Batillaria attramentaria]